MHYPKKTLLFVIIALVFFFDCITFARAPHKGGQMAEASGLQPLFPDKTNCVTISSPYGSPTRYDGSQRPAFRFGGKHGGIDLSLSEKTPLLAIADGVVVKKGKGRQMEGIYLWMQHSPENTGLPYWIYSKYQHLHSLPEISVGEAISVGQVVAYSGKTGTTGGHYGDEGYPHLHLSIIKAATGKHKVHKSKIVAPGSHLIDPLLIYQQTNINNVLKEPPSGEGTVLVPVMSADGNILPNGARIIWPVACSME